MTAPAFPRFPMLPYWIWLGVILAPTAVPWATYQVVAWRLAADGCSANFKMGSGCGPALDMMRQLQVGIEMEPALPALILGTGVPGDAQRLIATIGEADQILLQGIHAEGVADLIILQRAVRSVGADHELAVTAEEGGSDVGVGEIHVVEIAEYGLFRGRLHRLGVLRTVPSLIFGAMASGAALGANIAAAGRIQRRMPSRQSHRQGLDWFVFSPCGKR